jgi:hypothetical protein
MRDARAPPVGRWGMASKLDSGDRLGLGGLIVGLFAIAAFYFWPDKKWIGWPALFVAGGLCLYWIIAEVTQRISKIESQGAVRIVGISLSPIVVGAPISLSIRIANDRKTLRNIISKYAFLIVDPLPSEIDHLGRIHI